jgi:hypothetical protein
MLHENSVRIAHNLAVTCNLNLARPKNYTPLPSTLMGEMCASVKNAMIGPPEARYEESLCYAIVQAAEGSFDRSKTNAIYNLSTHDSLMDNYSKDLAATVSAHVVYARATVYKEMNDFVDQVTSETGASANQQAEDLFKVSFISSHPILGLQFIEEEISSFKNAPIKSTLPFNFRQALAQSGLDICQKLCQGQQEDNTVITDWVNVTGADKLMGYVGMAEDSADMVLSAHEALDYHLLNFLFFRSLVKEPNLGAEVNLGLTLTQLVNKASDSRDYHASQLAVRMEQQRLSVNQGMVISPDTQGSYSYLSKTGVRLCVYEQAFTAACEQGATIEQLFGHVAKYGNAPLYVEQLVANGVELTAAWQTQRTIYSTYVAQNRHQSVRSSMKFTLRRIMSEPCHEETMCDIYQATGDHKANTLAQAESFIDRASQSELDDLQQMALQVIAGIVHRHSNAKAIISRMMELMEKDSTLDTAHAVSVSVALYLTDYLLAQLRTNC